MAGKLFPVKTQDQQASSLASFMPGGRPFLAAKIDNTTLRSLLIGLAGILSDEEGVLNDITYEHQIDQTTQLLEQWEAALGLPDDVFTSLGTLAERRNNILIKLGRTGVQSAQDFIDLAALLGFTVSIIPGADRGIFPLHFPVYIFDKPQTARFLMVTTVYTTAVPNVFPLAFPIVFGSGINTVLERLFTKLKPANVELAFEYTLPDLSALTDETGHYYLGLEDGTILLLEY